MPPLWGNPKESEPGAFAFRVFLDYDGQQGAFGDISVGASTPDADVVSIFAALRTSDGAVTVVLINKTGAEQPVNLTLRSPDDCAARVWRYSADDLAAIKPQDDLAFLSGLASTVLPPYSISMVISKPPAVAPQTPADPQAWPGD